jgi:hypothetical protein
MAPIRKQILQACSSFMVPVARFLLRVGIGSREFEEVSRLAFVKVASNDYGLRGRPTNASRVSAMTGIGRKDVSRLRKLIEEYDVGLRVRLSPLGDVLHHWHTDPDFLNKQGKPVPLPYSDSDISFEMLVGRCAGDVPAGAVRAELLRYGAISGDSAGILRVLRREVVPDSFDERLLASLSFNLTCLAETIAFNSNPKRTHAPRIERYVQSEDLDETAKSELREVIRRRVTAFTEEIDDLFSRYSTHEAPDKSRLGVGVYFHEDAD